MTSIKKKDAASFIAVLNIAKIFSKIPSKSPPINMPRGLSRPPIIATAKAFKPRKRPIKAPGCTIGPTRTPPIPARTPAIIKETEAINRGLMPINDAASLLNATASNALPNNDFFRKTYKRNISSAAPNNTNIS